MQLLASGIVPSLWWVLWWDSIFNCILTLTITGLHCFC